MRILVAPAAFKGTLRAPQVAAAIGRGLERAGLAPPELCPVAGGEPGTLEILLTALGGETVGAELRDGPAAAFALIEDGGTALVEPARSAGATGALIAAAAASGAAVVVVCAAGAGGPVVAVGAEGAGRAGGGATAVVDALDDAGGTRGAALVVLCDPRAPSDLAAALRDGAGARLVAGPGFVLEALEFDARMRAAHAVIVGEGRLQESTLRGRVTGEIATRARQSGVPCHAIVGANAMDRFSARILDLQAILEAPTVAELEAAGAAIVQAL